MNLMLPLNAEASDVESWLRHLVREFGLGFHLDTPAHEYVTREGLRAFTSNDCVALDDSVERALHILAERSYEICMSEMEAMLHQHAETGADGIR